MAYPHGSRPHRQALSSSQASSLRSYRFEPQRHPPGSSNQGKIDISKPLKRRRVPAKIKDKAAVGNKGSLANKGTKQSQSVATSGQTPAALEPWVFRFMALPIEIRAMIIKCVVVMPAGLIISDHPYLNFKGSKRRREGFKLGYAFDGLLTRLDPPKLELKPPTISATEWAGRGRQVVVESSWTMDPTEEQLRQLEAGTWEQPHECYSHHSAVDVVKVKPLGELHIDKKLACWANRRDGGGSDKPRYEMTYVDRREVHGLNGNPLLLVSKQVSKETIEPLFGGNRFIFRHGPKDEERMMASNNQGLGPFGDWALSIGAQNFSLVKNIKLEGDICHSWFGSIDFPRFLPVFTEVVQKFCPNLKQLTLHNYAYGKYGHESRVLSGYFDDLLDLRTPAERLQRWHYISANHGWIARNMVEKVVAALPNLEELRLGDYSIRSKQSTGKKNFEPPENRLLVGAQYPHINPPPPPDYLGNDSDIHVEPDEWRDALHLTDIVKERARQQKINNVRRAGFGCYTRR